HDIFSDEQFLIVREKQYESMRLILKGYRVKEFLAAEFEEESLRWMLGAGNRLRRDYSNWFQKHGVPKPESSQWPRLVGLTKEEVLANPGSSIPALFLYTPSRFQFDRSQRMIPPRASIGKNS